MREDVLAKSSIEGSSREIIVFKLISSFTLSGVKRDFRDSNQNKQNVKKNLKKEEKSLKGNQFYTEQNEVQM